MQEYVAAHYSLGEYRPLQLSQREERQLWAEGRLNGPPVTRLAVILGVGNSLFCSGATHLELVAAFCAPHRRSALADERVVEFILGVATLALYVHRWVGRRSDRVQRSADVLELVRPAPASS